MVNDAGGRARNLFESDFCCTESVLMAVAEARGVKSDVIPRIATGFCGGVARTCGMCGAVSGAIMGLGLVAGRDSQGQSIEPVYALTKKMLEEFNRAFGSTNCRDLIGCDLGTSEGQAFFKEHKMRERCSNYVEKAARIAIGLVGGKA